MDFKALFIVPSQKKVYGMKIDPPYPPLGILYIGAVLESLRVGVKVLDIDADKLNVNMMLASIKEFKPDIIGMTVTTPVINDAFNTAGIIKEHFDIPIVLGGIHATMNPEECIKRPSIDFIVKGEGEDTIKELILEMTKARPNLDGVRGLYYKKDGGFHFTGERDLIAELDRIPFPARHLLNNLRNYKPPDAEHLPVASVMTTRGCPGRCSYCCTKNIFKDRYRMRGIDNVIAEIDDCVGRFKVKEIHIADDAFNVNRGRVLKICDAIRKRKYNVTFEFLNGLRADIIDKEILDAFKSIGIKNVGFGVESADRGILRNIKKNIMPETVERATMLAKKNGFKTWAFFMIGLPGETEATIKKNAEFAKKLDPDFAKFLIFKPFPGSEIYEEMKKKGLIDDFNFDNYGVYTPPVHHLQNLTEADLLYWQKQAFREFYFRPKKIWSHIKRQKSISQLKLSLRGLSFVCFNAFKKDAG
jgi:anaerobic magnesium-protoporphyrin IX monomethyl ester cyclase